LARCGGFYAAVDVGTTNIKLGVYDDGFNLKLLVRSEAPLKIRGRSIRHDGASLVLKVKFMVEKAYRSGARCVGLSVYRGSVASWSPGAAEPSDVYLWLDAEAREKARSSLGFRARILSKAPLLSKLFGEMAPLPLLLWLASRRRGGSRVWSVDALLIESLTGSYASEPVNSGIMGALDPFTGRAVRLHRLAGFSGEDPEFVDHSFSASLAGSGGVSVGPVIGDQQASMIASGCLRLGCAKIDLGTGFFGDAELGLAGLASGLTPIIGFLDKGAGVMVRLLEAGVPGAGLALSAIAGVAGGFRALASLDPGRCASFSSPALLGYPSVRGAPAPLVHVSGAARADESIACSALLGAAFTSAWLIARLGAREAVAVGGASRLVNALEAAAALTGASIRVYPGLEASLLGAARLAAYASGSIGFKDLIEPPAADYVHVKPRSPPKRIVRAVGRWLEEASRGCSECLREALGLLESGYYGRRS
jgi:glycerol kinase